MGKPLEFFKFEWASKLSASDLMAFGAIPVAVVIITISLIVVSSWFRRRNWEKMAEMK